MAPQSWGPQSHYHWGSEEKSEKTNYVQRDLEDQIEEEYRTQGREYQRTDTNNSDNMSSSTAPEIVIQDVLDLLKKGYTRLKKDDLGFGSIQERYGLNGAAVKELFMNPKLAKKKTVPPKTSFVLIDRDEPTVPTEAEVEDLLNEVAITVGGEVIPAQDVVVTSIDAPQLAAGTTSREELFS